MTYASDDTRINTGSLLIFSGNWDFFLNLNLPLYHLFLIEGRRWTDEGRDREIRHQIFFPLSRANERFSFILPTQDVGLQSALNTLEAASFFEVTLSLLSLPSPSVAFFPSSFFSHLHFHLHENLSLSRQHTRAFSHDFFFLSPISGDDLGAKIYCRCVCKNVWRRR